MKIKITEKNIPAIVGISCITILLLLEWVTNGFLVGTLILIGSIAVTIGAFILIGKTWPKSSEK